MKKLIAAVRPGDLLVMPDGSMIEVRMIEWLTYSPVVIVNGLIIFAKGDWVEVAE